MVNGGGLEIGAHRNAFNACSIVEVRAALALIQCDAVRLIARLLDVRSASNPNSKAFRNRSGLIFHLLKRERRRCHPADGRGRRIKLVLRIESRRSWLIEFEAIKKEGSSSSSCLRGAEGP
jgi:hypothetical protein